MIKQYSQRNTSNTSKKDDKKFDSLFGENKIDLEALSNLSNNKDKNFKQIEIDKLVEYKNHPFTLYKGQRFNDMVESIKDYGVINPVIVRKLDDEDEKYEILSGHNRVNASKLAGLIKVPSIIKNVNDDEVFFIVTETNLIQRSFSEMPYTERALIISMRYDEMKRQKIKRELIEEIEMINIDLQDEYKKTGRIDDVAGEYNLSPSSIKRYLRINTLNKTLKEMIDERKLGFIAGVNLSYLKDDEIDIICEILKQNEKVKINNKKSVLLKENSKTDKLTYEVATKIILGDITKKKKSTNKRIYLTDEILQKYFEDENQKQILQIVERSLEYFFNNHEN